MARKDDIERIRAQEQTLVFKLFNEAEAVKLGGALHAAAVAEKLPLAIEIGLWDRRLFYATTAGATADNQEWVRRKFNLVRRLQAASYRTVLEQDRDDRMFPPHRTLDVSDYALAGGGFPIRVQNAGVIGAVIVSGLPQREDHNLIIRVLAGFLGHDAAALALGPE